MGVLLKNLDKSGGDLAVPYPHWRSIVEAVKRLDVLPPKTAEMLHHEFENSGLSQAEARAVAEALREKVLSWLGPDQELWGDGDTSFKLCGGLKPPDLYNDCDTNPETLTTFVEYCESCEGFEI